MKTDKKMIMSSFIHFPCVLGNYVQMQQLFI